MNYPTLHPLPVKRLIFLPALAIFSLLSSCTGYPRLLSFPFDPAGRGLNSPAGEITPQISGRYIVFVSDRKGRQDIYLYDGIARRLIDLPGLNSLDMIASHPAVSEDGRFIVFAGSRQGRIDIYLYNRELRLVRNLTENLQAEVRNPTISADGSRIAFEAGAQGQWNIKVIDSSGQPLNVPDIPR